MLKVNALPNNSANRSERSKEYVAHYLHHLVRRLRRIRMGAVIATTALLPFCLHVNETCRHFLKHSWRDDGRVLINCTHSGLQPTRHRPSTALLTPPLTLDAASPVGHENIIVVNDESDAKRRLAHTCQGSPQLVLTPSLRPDLQFRCMYSMARRSLT